MIYNFCTYFDRNYLYRGVTMYRSLMKFTQDFRLWILCFDERTYGLLSKMNLKNVELISLEEFEDSELLEIKCSRSPVEYFWTCTPSLPLYILRKHSDLDRITYLDADLYFYSDPSPIFKECRDGSILLTEHRHAKNTEKRESKNGRYNVQFLTFRNDEVGRSALRWWRERCLEWCFVRSEDGKFGDQKYLDDWKSRFPGVWVIQHKGAGLAPWNIAGYDLRKVGEKIFVDEDELIFYHFHFLRMYSKTLYNLSHVRLTGEQRRLIYAPYIGSLMETIDYVEKIDASFSDGFTVLKFNRKMDLVWLLFSFFRGNFMFNRGICQGKE
jgi:hypothetical protein